MCSRSELTEHGSSQPGWADQSLGVVVGRSPRPGDAGEGDVMGRAGSLFRVVVGSVLIAGSVLVLSGAPASAVVTPTGVNISPIETESFTGTVATFTSPDAGPFTATIDWGDGTSASTGTVTSTGPGAYSVSGTHTYATDGSYTITTTIGDASDLSSTPVTSTANVQEGSFLLEAGSAITATEGTPWTGTVATFTDSQED